MTKHSARKLPGRDRRAVHHPAAPGAERITESRHVVVVGGGIAGVAAATALAERGVTVTLCEATDRLGGRVSAWPIADGRSMSRGFHAFFRQYYNLRALLKRVDPDLVSLTPLEDYPLVRPDGLAESFRGLPTKPPWSFIEFVRRSPSFTLRSLARVNVPAALELLRVKFPQTYADYDGESAEEFLNRLRFPDDARDLALEVFARSFFAHPSAFGAGELVSMFHTYFLGSAEGLLFDVPVDDYESTIWAPLRAYLTELGVSVRTETAVDGVTPRDGGVTVDIGGEQLDADAVVLATDPRTARKLVADLSDRTDPADRRDPIDSVERTNRSGDAESAGNSDLSDVSDPTANTQRDWFDAVAATHNAPPFVVVRLWFDRHVDDERPAFLGTSGYGPLDNVSVLERFETNAATWSKKHQGSVVELHAYASPAAVTTDPDARNAVVAELRRELERVYPETRAFTVLHEEVLVQDDCGLIGPHGWGSRPAVTTPWSTLMLAGDWVRCDYPVALMERATTTGFLAANELLSQWGVRGEDLWTAPMSGMLKHRSPRRVMSVGAAGTTTS